jgi:hypothetical protein
MKKLHIIVTISTLFVIAATLWLFLTAPYRLMKVELRNLATPELTLQTSDSSGQIFNQCPCVTNYYTSNGSFRDITQSLFKTLISHGYPIRTAPGTNASSFELNNTLNFGCQTDPATNIIDFCSIPVMSSKYNLIATFRFKQRLTLPDKVQTGDQAIDYLASLPTSVVEFNNFEMTMKLKK